LRCRRGGRRNCFPYRRTIAVAGSRANADAVALVHIGAFPGDAPDDILGG
jgi:hypothetical protein